jgi:hypothetical protein
VWRFVSDLALGWLQSDGVSCLARITKLLVFFLAGEATNAALNENPRELIAYLKPVVEKTVKNIIQKIANKITQHFTLQELLPEN